MTPGAGLVVRRLRRGSPYKGKVTAYDNAIYIADAAVYLMKAKPELNITNPYALDADAARAAVKDLVASQKAIIGEYWSDAFKQIDSFKSRRHPVGTSWQYQVNSLEGTASPSVKPKEGCTGWSDTWMVKPRTPRARTAPTSGSTGSSRPKTNAEVAEWFGEAPANAKSCDLTADKDHCAHVPRDRHRGTGRTCTTGTRRPRTASTVAPT